VKEYCLEFTKAIFFPKNGQSKVRITHLRVMGFVFFFKKKKKRKEKKRKEKKRKEKKRKEKKRKEKKRKGNGKVVTMTEKECKQNSRENGHFFGRGCREKGTLLFHRADEGQERRKEGSCQSSVKEL